MEETLGCFERHKHAAVFKAVRRFQNADNVERSVTNLDTASEFCRQKLRGALSENYIVGVLREIRTITFEPCRLANASVGACNSETGDDGMIGARNDSEENGIGVLHELP